MADYEQIKTLTIDGQTMGLKEGLGITSSRTNTRQDAVWESTYYDGASLRLQPGAYIVRARVKFPTPPTTGTVRRSLQIYAGDTLLSSVRYHDAYHAGADREAVCVVSTSTAVTANVRFETSKALPANAGLETSIWATPILRIPTTE